MSNSSWIFSFIALIIFMIVFGRYIQRQYWTGNLGTGSPGGPSKSVYMSLHEDPVDIL